MKKVRASFWIAGFCLAYWAVFYPFVFSDLYLTFDTAGFLLKLLVPVVFVANLVGTVLGFASWSKRRTLAGLAAALNALPVMGLLWFVWWLFFGVKI